VIEMDGVARRQGGQRRKRLVPASALAALIHLQIVLLVGLFFYLRAPRDADLARLNAEPIEISALDEEQSREVVAELQKKEEEERKKEEEEKPTAPGQVVDLPSPQRETPPREARFAAERDSSVDKEMRHPGPPEQARAAAAQPPAVAMRTPPPRPPSQPRGMPGSPGAPATPSGQSPETEAVAPPGVAGQPGSQEPPAPPRPMALMPSQETLARALGGGTSDYLPEIDEGENTALNARKWKFASFFNRVKQQIRQHWHAAQEYQKRDPTGSVYGGRAHFTLLRVQLRPDGSLVDVQLEQPSGIDFLDDVAVEAVKGAQPFPNPPQQLVDAGRISFRFGFVVDVSGEPRLKVFRYSSM
jgi:TonB family protein